MTGEIIQHPRGVIRYRDRARQIVDFRDLCFGTITPTDVDGLIEYRGRCYLLIELKHHLKPQLDNGQRLAFERLADDCAKPFLVLVAMHAAPTDVDISAANAIVDRYYWRKEWRETQNVVSVRDAAVMYFKKHGGMRL